LIYIYKEDYIEKEEYKKALEQYEKDMELWKQHRRETLLIELKNLEKEL